MIMVTSATVLVLASAGYLAWDYYRLRADLSDELGAQAQLVLENSAAALNIRRRPRSAPRRSRRWRPCRASAPRASTMRRARCSPTGGATRQRRRAEPTAAPDNAAFRAGMLDLRASRRHRRQEVRQRATSRATPGC